MFKRMFLISFMVVVIGGLMALPAAAQNDDAGNRDNGTITVTGQGTAAGLPDTAYVELGFESRNSSIRTAFAESNETVQAIIAALEELGIAREDIRTTGLNIYRDYYGFSPMGPGMSEGGNDNMYIVNNNVRVVIRDIDLIAEAINAAVDAGANQIYGLSFDISDTAELESEARADAIADARARAGELADLTGLTLGSVVRVVEYTGGYGIPFHGGNMMADGLGSGAVVEPGTLTVNVSVEVTFNTGG